MASASFIKTCVANETDGALSFLAEDRGFSGPELTADGVAYHRVGLHVEMGLPDGREIARRPADPRARA